MHRLLVAGAVGDAVAHEYLTWSAAQDLPDPEVLLADVEAASFTGMRADRVFVTLQSVHAAVSRDTTPDRWVAAVRLCALAAQQASLDPAVPVVRSLLRPEVRPERHAHARGHHRVRARPSPSRGCCRTAAVMDHGKLAAAKLWLISPPPDGRGRRSAERPATRPALPLPCPLRAGHGARPARCRR